MGGGCFLLMTSQLSTTAAGAATIPTGLSSVATTTTRRTKSSRPRSLLVQAVRHLEKLAHRIEQNDPDLTILAPCFTPRDCNFRDSDDDDNDDEEKEEDCLVDNDEIEKNDKRNSNNKDNNSSFSSVTSSTTASSARGDKNDYTKNNSKENVITDICLERSPSVGMEVTHSSNNDLDGSKSPRSSTTTQDVSVTSPTCTPSYVTNILETEEGQAAFRQLLLACVQSGWRNSNITQVVVKSLTEPDLRPMLRAIAVLRNVQDILVTEDDSDCDNQHNNNNNNQGNSLPTLYDNTNQRRSSLRNDTTTSSYVTTNGQQRIGIDDLTVLIQSKAIGLHEHQVSRPDSYHLHPMDALDTTSLSSSQTQPQRKGWRSLHITSRVQLRNTQQVFTLAQAIRLPINCRTLQHVKLHFLPRCSIDQPTIDMDSLIASFSPQYCTALQNLSITLGYEHNPFGAPMISPQTLSLLLSGRTHPTEGPTTTQTGLPLQPTLLSIELYNFGLTSQHMYILAGLIRTSKTTISNPLRSLHLLLNRPNAFSVTSLDAVASSLREIVQHHHHLYQLEMSKNTSNDNFIDKTYDNNLHLYPTVAETFTSNSFFFDQLISFQLISKEELTKMEHWICKQKYDIEQSQQRPVLRGDDDGTLRPTKRRTIMTRSPPGRKNSSDSLAADAFAAAVTTRCQVVDATERICNKYREIQYYVRFFRVLRTMILQQRNSNALSTEFTKSIDTTEATHHVDATKTLSTAYDPQDKVLNHYSNVSDLYNENVTLHQDVASASICVHRGRNTSKQTLDQSEHDKATKSSRIEQKHKSYVQQDCSNQRSDSKDYLADNCKYIESFTRSIAIAGSLSYHGNHHDQKLSFSNYDSDDSDNEIDTVNRHYREVHTLSILYELIRHNPSTFTTLANHSKSTSPPLLLLQLFPTLTKSAINKYQVVKNVKNYNISKRSSNTDTPTLDSEKTTNLFIENTDVANENRNINPQKATNIQDGSTFHLPEEKYVKVNPSPFLLFQTTGKTYDRDDDQFFEFGESELTNPRVPRRGRKRARKPSSSSPSSGNCG